MQKPVTLFVWMFSFVSLHGQTTVQRPKLVVGIVVDQMRWDYLYRYYDRYAENGGFKRLLNQGFACDNTVIPYTPTVTACGHASIYTGSVPAIHGITGNGWWDRQLHQSIYCTQDASVKTIGSKTKLGQMSPKNLLSTTIGDELKLANNFKSKVIGIALKDRGAILPAGHSADAAYWYDNKTGDWISSGYYLKELPKWMKTFNKKKLADHYYKQGWNTMYPLDTYVQSTDEPKPYKSNSLGAGSHFPYDLKKYIGVSYNHISVTPHGNSFTLEMSKAALVAEQLGQDSITDLLAISFSSPDYIGHSFGPNSIEAEDGFLRLDKELGEFLDFLDEKTGKGQYLLFLTADHGAAQVPRFLKEHNVPAGHVNTQKMFDTLSLSLKAKFGTADLIINITNGQVVLDHQLMINLKLNKEEVIAWSIDLVLKLPGIATAFALDALEKITLIEPVKTRFVNGYFPARNGDIQLIYFPQWLEDFESGGTTHGVWNPYDSHIPLIWYGWHIGPGKSYREIQMTDIAPTLAHLLQVQMPSGNIGKPIAEIIK